MKKGKMKTGIELITEERKEQLEKHGRTIESDVANNWGQQLSTAACLLAWYRIEEGDSRHESPEGWHLPTWQKMHDKPYKERLVIAGALIAAELDRIIYNDDQN